MDGQVPDSSTIVGSEEEMDAAAVSLGPESPPDNGPYEQLVKYCLELYNKFDKSEYRATKITEIEEGRKAYELIADKSMELWDGASNEVLPLTAITVDNLEPRLVSGLVGRDPIMQFSMVGMTEKDDQTKLIETFYNQELKNVVRIETATMSIVHTLLQEGTYFGAPEYSLEQKKQKDFVYGQDGTIQIDPTTKRPVVQEVQVTAFEGGKIENIPFSDILCADDVGSIEKWEKCDKIRKVRPTYAELMRKKGKLGYIGDNIGPWLFGETGDGKKSDDAKSPSDNVAGIEVTGKKVIESAEFHISYPIYKDEDQDWKDQTNFEEEEIVVSIALKSKKIYRLVYKKDLLFSNESLIKRIRLFPEDGRSFGTSVYGKIKGMQKGGSDVFNAIINSFYVVMLGGGFYEEGAGLRGKISKQPGEYIQVDDIDKVKDVTPKINPAAYIGLFEVIMSLWERAGSISNPQIGRPDSKEKTATEIMVVIQEGNAKFDYQAKSTRDEFLMLLKTLYDLYYQYMPYDAKMVYNGQSVAVPRKAMKRDFAFSLSGSTAAANKAIERKEAEDLYNLGMANPLINPMQVVEDLLKAYGKMDVKKYIKPEIVQVLQQFMTDPQGVGAAIQQYVTIRNKTLQDVEGGGKPKVGPKAAMQLVQ